MKTTIAIVTYGQDLALLKRQLLSIYQYWQLDQLEEIVVVYNDEPKNYADFDDAIASTQHPEIKLTPYYGADLWPTQSYWDWFSQQHLKILIAKKIKTPWFIIHDSKDAYSAPASIDTFFVSESQARLPVAPGPAHEDVDNWVQIKKHPHVTFRSEYNSAYKWMSIDFDTAQTILRCDQKSTVFPAHTQTMLDMIAWIEDKLGSLFDDLIRLNIRGNSRALFTEYALISAWHAHQGLLEKLYLPLDQYRGQGVDFYECLIGRDKTLRGISHQDIQ